MINLATIRMAAKTGALWVAIAVLVSTNSCSYLVGRAQANAKHAEKELSVANKKAVAVKKEVEKRTPVVTAKEGKSAAAKERVNNAKKELYYATEQRQANPTCNLSDAELRSYGLLADEINAAINGSGPVQ